MKPALAATAVLALLAVLTATHAQQQIIGGRALDSSLQRGSSGFNRGRGGSPGLHAPQYNAYRHGSARANARQTSNRSFTIQSGGSTQTATYGRGGYSTLGNALTVPTYNPLAQGARVQHSTAPRYATPASYAGARTYTAPNYGTTSSRAPSPHTTNRYTTTARPNPSAYTTPARTSPTTTNPALTGLTRPTYSTFRGG